MRRGRSTATAVLLPLAFVLAAPASALAGKGAAPRSDFYAQKKLATTPDAFARAEQNLRQVAVGMTEIDFLAAMKVEVLAHRGKPVDARLDGYLPEASVKLNRAAPRGTRHMVFGYQEDGTDHLRVVVVLAEQRVAEVRELPVLRASADAVGEPAAKP